MFTWLDIAEAYREGWQDRGYWDFNHSLDPRDFGLSAADFRRAAGELHDERFGNLAMMMAAMPAGEGQ